MSASLKRILFALIISLVFSTTALAKTSSFSVIQFRPSPFVDRTFSVDGAKTQGFGNFAAALDVDYMYKPLKVSLTGVPGVGTFSDELMKNVIVTHFSASGSPADFVSLGITFPFVPLAQLASTFGTTGNVTGYESKTMKMGDLMFAAKFKILDPEKFPVGFAAEPFITFPTGKGDYALGTNKFTGGIKLILGQTVSFAALKLNLGYTYRPKYEMFGLDLIKDQHRLTYGIGADFEVYKNLYVLAEISGSTVLNDFFKHKFTSPLEGEAGIRYNIASAGLSLSLGGGAGILRGGGTPVFRILGGLQFQYGLLKGEQEEEEEVVEEDYEQQLAEQRAALMNRIKRVVYFRTGGANLAQADIELLSEVPQLFNNEALAGYSLVVAGYSDSRGKASVNKKVSLKRAKSVGNYLTSMGIDPSRVYIIGYGEEYPIADNSTEEGRAANRRVEVYVAQ